MAATKIGIAFWEIILAFVVMDQEKKDLWLDQNLGTTVFLFSEI